MAELKCPHCGETRSSDIDYDWLAYHEQDCELKTLRSKLKAADEAWHEQEDELQALRGKLNHASALTVELRTEVRALQGKLDALQKAARLLAFAAHRDQWPGREHTYFKELEEALKS